MNRKLTALLLALVLVLSLAACGAKKEEKPAEQPEVETEVPETEAEVVETEAEPTEEPEAPQTFDFGVIGALAAIVSLAAAGVSRKRR